MLQKWALFLRGVNVSGKNKLNMKEFKEALEKSKFSDVKTYIQSGNVVFSSSFDKQEIIQTVEKILFEMLHAEIPVFLHQKNEIQAFLSDNPFLNQGGDSKQQYVTFFHQSIDFGELNFEKFLPDEIHIANSICYLNCLTSYGSTKLNTSFLEKKANQPATTRNWNTLLKMRELLDE
jgi:uncharacterized protein (DUF1697 family)